MFSSQKTVTNLSSFTKCLTFPYHLFNFIFRIFLKLLPTLLMMRRPKKTRLRWMMETPNVTLPSFTYSNNSPTDFSKRLPSCTEAKSKIDIMELSDLHHPNCKINRKIPNIDVTGATSAEILIDRNGSESSDSILLSPEATKATEAVEFIAEHLRNEDLYIQVYFYDRQTFEKRKIPHNIS